MITLAALDRTLFEIVRRKVVSLGYLPDVSLFGPGQEQAYADAKQAIRDTGKQIIDIFGAGTPKARIGKTECKITIDRKVIKPGTVFTGNQVLYDKQQDGSYKKMTLPDSSYSVDYEIRCVSGDTEHERILYSVISSCFGTLRLIKPYNQLTNDFPINGDGIVVQLETYVNDNEEEIFEYIFRYSFLDVWLDGPTDLNITVLPIDTVEWSLIKMSGLLLPEVQDSTTMDILNNVLAP